MSTPTLAELTNILTDRQLVDYLLIDEVFYLGG